MTPYLFSSENLPDGFKYPADFEAFLSDPDSNNLDPWYLLCFYPDNADYWLSELKKQFPDRALVPFARVSQSDDLACFDGSDASGNPPVLYVHAFASPGWEDRGGVSDFKTWLADARELAATHAAEQAELDAE